MENTPTPATDPTVSSSQWQNRSGDLFPQVATKITEKPSRPAKLQGLDCNNPIDWPQSTKAEWLAPRIPTRPLPGHPEPLALRIPTTCWSQKNVLPLMDVCKDVVSHSQKSIRIGENTHHCTHRRAHNWSLPFNPVSGIWSCFQDLQLVVYKRYFPSLSVSRRNDVSITFV